MYIRQFLYPQDYPAVVNLWNNAGPGIHTGRSDSPEEINKKVQRDPDLFLVAEVEGEILGTVIGGFDGRRGMVYHLAVTEGYQREGIASDLMEALEARLRDKGCLKAYLLVTKDNIGAQRFYETAGWNSMDLFIFGKELA